MLDISLGVGDLYVLLRGAEVWLSDVLTTDQKVGDSSSSWRASETLYGKGFVA